MKYDNYYYINDIENFTDLFIGDKGPQGQKGIVGPFGDIGLKGLSGSMGPDGIQGPPGVTGIRGPKGDKGQRGQIGETGDKGFKGVRGPQGPAGKSGPKGPNGPRGKVGTQGLEGDKGVEGLKGNKGESGMSFSRNNADIGTYNLDNTPAPKRKNPKGEDFIQASIDAINDAYEKGEVANIPEKDKKELEENGILPVFGKWHRIPRSAEFAVIGPTNRCPENGAIVGVRSGHTYKAKLEYQTEQPCGCNKRYGIRSCTLWGPKYCWKVEPSLTRFQAHRDYEILCAPMPNKDGKMDVNVIGGELIDHDYLKNKEESLKKYPFHLPN